MGQNNLIELNLMLKCHHANLDREIALKENYFDSFENETTAH